MHDSAGLALPFLRCSCLCSPARDLHFSPAGPGNDLRGALGYVLPEEWFRPRTETGPSGLRDTPRPFVLRVSGMPETVEAGGVFGFGVHLFDRGSRELVESALQKVARAGIGPDRVPFLTQIEWVEVEAPLVMKPLGVRAAAVDFVTPTELKGHDASGAPPFEVLLARARDRISSLLLAYTGRAPEWDFAGLGERAAQVRLGPASLARARRSRLSSRTHQRHDLAGFTGRVTYEGALDEFLPILLAACHTGVGRHTVWGLGELRVFATAARYGTSAGSPDSPQSQP